MTDPSASPIVVFGDDWGRHVSTMQHVFRWINPQRPVVWINGIGHRKPQLSDLRRAWEKGLAVLRRPAPAVPMGDTSAPPPLSLIHPRVLPWHDRSAVHAFNMWSLRRAIRAELARLGFTTAPILVTGTPPSAGIVGTLGERASVYFCMDDFPHLPSVSADMIIPLEREMLDRVDVTVATARALSESKRPKSGASFYLPQGVAYDHFAVDRPEPAELRGLPHPRIGFAGGLYQRCDLPLIRRLATDHPGGSVVLVGPVAIDTSALSLPNIHVLGARPYAQLPAYLQAFDVGVIPYLLNDETRSVDPLKLLEYLAAGLPVVATAIPEIAKYAGAVRIGDSIDSFAGHVRAALAEPRAMVRERGRALARQHTWQRRAGEFLRIVDDAVARNEQGAPAMAAS